MLPETPTEMRGGEGAHGELGEAGREGKAVLSGTHRGLRRQNQTPLEKGWAVII